jgi:acyl dehydratase
MNKYTLETLSVGLEESFEVEITSEMQSAFCMFTKDVNPMHTDIQYANSKGFDKPLVYGMLTASFYSTLVGVYLPGKYCLFQECTLSFNAPVYIGDRLTISGLVKEVNSTLKRITIKARIRNQSAKTVSKATLVVGLV